MRKVVGGGCAYACPPAGTPSPALQANAVARVARCSRLDAESAMNLQCLGLRTLFASVLTHLALRGRPDGFLNAGMEMNAMQFTKLAAASITYLSLSSGS